MNSTSQTDSVRNTLPRLRTTVILVATTMVATACGALPSPSGLTSEDRESSPPAVVESVPGKTLVRGVCLDPSTSAGSVAGKVRDQLGDELASRIPDGEIGDAGAGPSDGIDLIVRLVTTTPYGSEQPNRHVRIPSVPGVPQIPDLSDPAVLGNDGPYVKWIALRDEANQQRETARAAAKKASVRIKRMPLPDKYLSGITGCLASLREIAGPNVDILLASDMEENVTRVAIRSLKGTKVTIIQACPSGNAASCRSNAESFKSWLQDAGAKVKVVRPEVTPQVVARFLGQKSA